MVTAPVSLVGPIVAHLSTIVMTMTAPKMLPHFSSAPPVPPLVVLAFSSSRPSVSLVLVYTSRDTNSIWSIRYRLEQRTPTSFVSPFDKNFIRLVGVLNEIYSMKVFLQRSLAILEENGQRH